MLVTKVLYSCHDSVFLIANLSTAAAAKTLNMLVPEDGRLLHPLHAMSGAKAIPTESWLNVPGTTERKADT